MRLKMKKSEVRRMIREMVRELHEGVSNKDVTEYLITALWSSIDDEGNPLDDNYTVRDVSKLATNQAKKDLNKFWSKAKNLLADDEGSREWTHDFWLTRNGHGSGFWDGDWDNGDELTKIAEKMGEVELYVGDDGVIHQM